MENVIVKIENITIIISENVVECLKKESIGNMETGGTVFGFKLKYHNEFIISGITLIQSEDKRTKFSFERKDEKHFEIINEVWKKDKSIMYIGDWHYHPSNDVYPSKRDFETFNDLRKCSFTSSKIFCNIITCKDYFIIYVFEKKSRKNYNPVKVCFNSKVVSNN